MKVYNAAHALAKAIRTNEDVKRFEVLREKIMHDEKYKPLFLEFQEKQTQLQKLEDDEMSPELIEGLKQVFKKLNAVDYIKEYFELELKINQMMSDITKILSEAIDIEY
jgi:cell fate (sporulation/competence/biofilm development) regulator YlbF (YheA/YmcA/DUF963 family)